MSRSAQLRTRALVLAVVVQAASTIALPEVATGQILSPGKLTALHADLEGLRNCTKCHELRRAGVAPDRCLGCHEPLAVRITQKSGYHASLEEQDCAECHKEHFGRDFSLVRFDTLTFDHEDAGYALDGEHVALGCRSCHVPALIEDATVRRTKLAHYALERTFLGLPTKCAACHEADDAHAGQFDDHACSACHDTGGWDAASGFDHERARYRLTGRHRAVECSSCHRTETSAGTTFTRFSPLRSSSCSSCHEDPHDGAMEGSCESCHSTKGWLWVDPSNVEGNLDHVATGFTLEGSHARIDCKACHDAITIARSPDIELQFVRGTAGRPFPRPVTGSCNACHVDQHAGAFDDSPGGPDCGGCHEQKGWIPTDYDATRHNREASFLLEGAHALVACASCHSPSPNTFVARVDAEECATCHARDDPHEQQFADRACDGCHSVESFRIGTFDHGRTRYPLDGSHRTASCDACHATSPGAGGRPVVRYRPLGTRCEDCHGGTP